MASVGGYTCNVLTGTIPGERERVTKWQVPGQDGHGAQKLGKAIPAFAMRAIHHDTAANIATWISNLEGTVGSIVTVVDEFGDTHTNVLVESVSIPRKRTIVYDGSINMQAEIALQMVKL